MKKIRQDAELICEAWKLGKIKGIKISLTDFYKNKNEHFRQAVFTTKKGEYKYLF